MGANLLCGLVGVAQGVVVLRLLGSDVFGAAAVLVAIGGIATNLIDVRVTDLVSRLYYDEQARQTSSADYRAGVLRLGLYLSAGSAVLITIVTAAVIRMAAPALTEVELSASTLWVASAAQGIGYLGSFFVFVQRFAASARSMAIVQTASALINASAMVCGAAASGTVGGYALGLAASASGMAILNAACAIAVLRRHGVVLTGVRRASSSVISRAIIARFMAAGNVLGYIKLLHRSADVLLVSAFCGDAQTGLYKVARSIADALYTFSEAINRIYQPRLFELLHRGDTAQFASVGRTMGSIAAVITMAAALGQLVLLPHLAPVFRVADSSTLTASAVTLSLSFFFAAGVQAWMWPAVVFFERLGRCTLWGMVAVLAGQYLLGPVLFRVMHDGSPLWFCVGYLSFYPLSLYPLWRELQPGQLALRLRAQVARS